MNHTRMTQLLLAVSAIAVLAVPGIVFAQEFEFKAGYPEPETSRALYDEMDYQRAVPAYIWTTPLLNSMGFRADIAKCGVDEKNGRFLRPWQVIVPPEVGVVTLVTDEEYAIVATLRQEVLNRIQPGDEAEIAFGDHSGRTLSAKVKNINWAILQGQVAASGGMSHPTAFPHGQFFVQFELDDDEGLKLPAGEAGAATIYTSRDKMWVPVRKVFFRWYTWLNYIMTDMDLRGPRQ